MSEREMGKLRREWEWEQKTALTALRHQVKKNGIETMQRVYWEGACRATQEQDIERARACVLAWIRLIQMELWKCTVKRKTQKVETASRKELARLKGAIETTKNYWG